MDAWPELKRTAYNHIVLNPDSDPLGGNDDVTSAYDVARIASTSRRARCIDNDYDRTEVGGSGADGGSGACEEESDRCVGGGWGGGVCTVQGLCDGNSSEV